LGDDAIVEVANAKDLRQRVEAQAARLGRECFAEQYIEGREFNVALLTGRCRPDFQAGRNLGTDWKSVPPFVLPPAEIDFSTFPADKPQIVGYAAKWDAASFEFHQTPRRFDFPPEDGPLLQQLAHLASRCWEVFDLSGYVRVDFRVDHAGQPWILEINTNPCLSPDAGYAATLERAGIAYEEATERIVAEAAGVRSQRAAVRGQQSAVSSQQTVISRPNPPSADSRLLTPDSCPSLRHHVLPSDPVAVRQIVESTGFFSPAESDVAVELLEERLAKGDASGYFFVFAESAGRPVAYACYGPIACTVGSFDLFWIAVDQEHQRHGLGRLLLEESERLIRTAGGRRVYIETSNRPQYVPTRAFYERCGYRCEAVLKDFYGVGDDKVVFVKAL
jgi:GNAT superfamily N-acetyltransferase